MLEHLTASYAEYPAANITVMRNRMRKELFEGDASRFESSVKELFSHIPYQLHIPREAYYHSLLLLWLKLLGFEVQGEVSTNLGRIDAVWTWDSRVIVAEVKYAAEGRPEDLAEAALRQISEKKYYEPFMSPGKKVSLLAAGFAGREIACRIVDLCIEE